MTRWLINSFNIWPFRTINFCTIAQKIAKVGSLFCQILNKRLKKSGHIGWEPRSSGNGRRLVFMRLWVRFQTFSHLFLEKLYCLSEKDQK